ARFLEQLHLLGEDRFADPGLLADQGELGLVGGREDRADLEARRGMDEGVEAWQGHCASSVICARQAWSQTMLPRPAATAATAPQANGAQARPNSSRSPSPASVSPISV